MFTDNIKKIEEYLNYHKKKSRAYLIAVWVCAILIMVVVMLFAGYMQFALKMVASTFIETAHNIQSIKQTEFPVPDYAALINENYSATWAISGLLFAILASLGMLKHHASRTIHFESELLTVLRLQSLSSIESNQEKLAQNLIDSTLAQVSNDSSKVVLNPVLEAITESTSKIIDKVTSNSK